MSSVLKMHPSLSAWLGIYAQQICKISWNGYHIDSYFMFIFKCNVLSQIHDQITNKKQTNSWFISSRLASIYARLFIWPLHTMSVTEATSHFTSTLPLARLSRHCLVQYGCKLTLPPASTFALCSSSSSIFPPVHQTAWTSSSWIRKLEIPPCGGLAHQSICSLYPYIFRPYYM